MNKKINDKLDIEKLLDIFITQNSKFSAAFALCLNKAIMQYSLLLV